MYMYTKEVILCVKLMKIPTTSKILGTFQHVHVHVHVADQLLRNTYLPLGVGIIVKETDITSMLPVT